MSAQRVCAVSLTMMCVAPFLRAQNQGIEPMRPHGNALIRPYLTSDAPPVRLGDSKRLTDLIRAAMLYLTVQDAIALAMDNNLDIEVARYNPLLATWQLTRSQAGGALPGVPGGASQAGSVANGQGVAGSQAAAGVSIGGQNGGGGASTNASVGQVGPITQVLDPVIQETSTFSHVSTPEPDVVQSITPNLISNSRAHSFSLQQGLLTGGGFSLSYSDHYLNENSPTDVLNPSSSMSLSLAVQHNLLRGFGTAVNARTININKINLATSELNFKTQVTSTVVNVLNLYYGLVTDLEDIKAKRSAYEVARQFYEDTRQKESLGAVSGLDVTTAETQAASAQANLILSETTALEQELSLKAIISRRGLADPALESARIVPMDGIVVPAKEDIPPLKDLVKQALEKRSDLAAARANVTVAETSAIGTKNGVLPTLQVFGGTSQAGLAGTPTAPVGSLGGANPYFVGGAGNALGQTFRRDFPTERIGAYLQAPIGNRQAQADLGIDQLQLRQTELTTQKTLNQVAVDVSNSVIALRQARARYRAAIQNRVLDEQLLSAERQKFDLGASTPYNVILQQRDLATAQAAEVAAMAAYSNARVALDLATGMTLEANHVSLH